MIQTYDVLGIPISVVNLERASDQIIEWANDDKGRYVGVREVASVMAMRSRPELSKIAREADMNVPDGMPLVWIGKWRGLPVDRTCGPDLMERMLLQGPNDGLRHFFYGGKDGVADKLAEVFSKRAPGVKIVGTYSPPFRELSEDENDEVLKKIVESKADIVWVGISSPKQDVWMARQKDRLPVTMIGVGAAFDFHSGQVKRAPRWMQKSGLESLHRLCSEPRRLWRRYLIQAPKFLLLVILSKKNGK